MAYKETAKSTKVYGEDKVNDWNLKYQFETTGEEKPKSFQVTGDNGKGGFVNANVMEGNENISFGGGAKTDLEVSKLILDTCAKLAK